MQGYQLLQEIANARSTLDLGEVRCTQQDWTQQRCIEIHARTMFDRSSAYATASAE